MRISVIGQTEFLSLKTSNSFGTSVFEPEINSDFDFPRCLHPKKLIEFLGCTCNKVQTLDDICR